jgi:hypothetical protein
VIIFYSFQISIFLQFKAEADLRVAQAEFDKQSEILKLLLEGIQTAYVRS